MSVFLQLVLVQLALWGSFHPLLGMGNTAEQDTVSLSDADERPYGKTVKEIRISRLRFTKRGIIIRQLASPSVPLSRFRVVKSMIGIRITLSCSCF